MITLGEDDPINKENLEDYEPGLYNSHNFTFDRIFGENARQDEVYEHVAKPAVMSMLQGYNASIIAYGQTGAGKTYTMEGFNYESGEERGLLPRSVESIFNYIPQHLNSKTKFLVRASYLQIYNEVISDLLKPERQNLSIREDKRKGIYVEGLSEWIVRTPQEIYDLMKLGGAMRATGSTKMNEMSSRSHAIFIIIAEQSENFRINSDNEEETLDDAEIAAEMANNSNDDRIRQRFKVGKLNLVDLAGSERVRQTGATGQRLEETKKINQSLSALGNVVAALTDPKGRPHIPFRDSKLTRILEDSLGGNCKTTMTACISPAFDAFSETLSTIKFANRAKNIKNTAEVNVDLDQKSLLRKYEKELMKLRSELSEKSKNVVDKRSLLNVEEKRRRAEQDKLAAISALEQRSRSLMQEKKEKVKLEERIKHLQGQLLVGGGDEEIAAFQSALQQEHFKITAEYDVRLTELDRERQSLDEDKAQVDRYKQLLVKQRDIMIALTSRLHERDETIAGIQEELDAYDDHQKVMEDEVDQKNAVVYSLQNALAQSRHSDTGEASNSKSKEVDNSAEEIVQDRRAIEDEYKEVEAEKVSLEYLLQEKLEKMVQVEIEDRVNNYCQNHVDEQSHLLQNPHVQNELNTLKSKMKKEEEDLLVHLKEKERQLSALETEQRTLLEQNGGHRARRHHEDQLTMALENAERTRAKLKEDYEHELADFFREKRSAENKWRGERQGQLTEMLALKQQCATNEKERVALKTILDIKIKGLVDNIARCAVEKQGALKSTSLILREVQALQKLIDAILSVYHN